CRRRPCGTDGENVELRPRRRRRRRPSCSPCSTYSLSTAGLPRPAPDSALPPRRRMMSRRQPAILTERRQRPQPPPRASFGNGNGCHSADGGRSRQRDPATAPQRGSSSSQTTGVAAPDALGPRGDGGRTEGSPPPHPSSSNLVGRVLALAGVMEAQD